ncbi:MAG: hypothetical protein ACI9XZ_003069 [Alphaproteobacteria bacterium]|jgi:hypothetical protein
MQRAHATRRQRRSDGGLARSEEHFVRRALVLVVVVDALGN